jgi:hypothetical protein
MGLLNAVTAAILLTCGMVQSATTGSSDPCSCDGAVTAGRCFKTVAEAIAAAENGGTVTVGGKKIITEEIIFAKDLTIQVHCSQQSSTDCIWLNQKAGVLISIPDAPRRV